MASSPSAAPLPHPTPTPTLSCCCCHIRHLPPRLPPPERYSKIEHENRLLLGRMSEILTKPGGDNSYAQGARHGYTSRGEAPARGRAASLSAPAQRAESARIARANLALLGRLQATKPVLSARTWAQEAAANAALVARISEYAVPSTSPIAASQAAGSAHDGYPSETLPPLATPLPGFSVPATAATAGSLSWSFS